MKKTHKTKTPTVTHNVTKCYVVHLSHVKSYHMYNIYHITCGKFIKCGYAQLKKTTRKRDTNGTTKAIREKKGPNNNNRLNNSISHIMTCDECIT